ncbi:restriction endonuclease subunit S [Sphaerimonospora mesophila]|uniref:restriction endonuclease subunit S n=1 Tax=Sphaerimonospora mesophila TaxID=37483 RepID=UPI0009FB0BB8
MTLWSIVPLGSIATIQAGTGFPVRYQGKTFGAYPFAKVGDISKLARAGGSQLSHADNYVSAADVRELKARIVPEGSIVFAKIGEAIRQNFCAITVRPCLVDNNVMAVSPDKCMVDLRYFYHFWKSLDLYPLADSTTVPSIRKSTLEKLAVPLPPLDKQRQIAEVLDRADALRAQRWKAISLLDSLAQSIFRDMFGDPVENDRSWPVAEVADFIKGFESGKNLAAGEENGNTRYRILKVSAVTSGVFKAEESKPAPEGYIPPMSHVVRDGDLLFSRANTAELIGATALAINPPLNALLPDKLWRFLWYSPARANVLYVRHLFRQPGFRCEVSRKSTGSSGSMKNISQAKVLSIECGLPPLDLQNAFGERVASIEQLRSLYTSHLAELDNLFASLQQRAFRGELWDTRDN